MPKKNKMAKINLSYVHSRYKVMKLKNRTILMILADNISIKISESRACRLIVNSDNSNKIGFLKHLLVRS